MPTASRLASLTGQPTASSFGACAGTTSAHKASDFNKVYAYYSTSGDTYIGDMSQVNLTTTGSGSLSSRVNGSSSYEWRLYDEGGENQINNTSVVSVAQGIDYIQMVWSDGGAGIKFQLYYYYDDGLTSFSFFCDSFTPDY